MGSRRVKERDIRYRYRHLIDSIRARVCFHSSQFVVAEAFNSNVMGRTLVRSVVLWWCLIGSANALKSDSISLVEEFGRNVQGRFRSQLSDPLTEDLRLSIDTLFDQFDASQVERLGREKRVANSKPYGRCSHSMIWTRFLFCEP